MYWNIKRNECLTRMQAIILHEKGSYIIQRYIHTRTKMDEPYHIRAHVQKNGEGKWQLTHIYPRIGNKKSNLSNISTDGRIEDLHTFLEKKYGGLGEKYEQDILKLSLDLAWHLDKLHGLSLDELGIDLAIDDNGRYWMHEANNGPQTAYHEEKRAANTIAYALYIAKNGLVHTDSSQRTGLKGQFHARTSQIPFASPGDRPSIGMLAGKIVNDKLAIASAKAAEEENMSLYSFTPKDIDYDELLIKGYFYENEEWVPKIVEFPNVIFDRLKLKDTKNAQMIYEELEDIPFTNEWPGQIKKRSDLYDLLQSSGELTDSLPSYQTVTKTREIARFIEKHGRILFKLDITAFSSNGYSIEQATNGDYLVSRGTAETAYREFAFMNFLKRQLKDGEFLIQKCVSTTTADEQPFEIHAHLMKDRENNWSLPSLYASSIKQTEGKPNEYFRENLDVFLGTHYGAVDAVSIEEQVKRMSLETVIVIEKLVEYPMGEVALTWGLDRNNQLKLIDVNPNGSEIIYDATETANGVVSYAIYLAELNIDVLLSDEAKV